MKKQKMTPVGIALVAAILLVVSLLVRSGLHRTASVVLPAPAPQENPGEVTADPQRESVQRVSLTTDTVQYAVATLSRPEDYSRDLYLERFYSGGSNVSAASVRVDGAWTRIDLTEGGETRHVITGDGNSYVWYGTGTPWYAGYAAFTADEEQSIPTYEDILKLETERIAAADYRIRDETDCIYVETVPDGDGFAERYWVSIGTGLLAASEKLLDGEVIYRMEGRNVERGGVTEEAFTLPDGTVLHKPS